MVVLNRIYTRTGDDGTTALGTGERRKKYDLRIAAYGTVDELNAAIGVARLHTADERDDRRHAGAHPERPVRSRRRSVRRPRQGQGPGGARLRGHRRAGRRGSSRRSTRSTRELAPLRSFVLPGGSAGGGAPASRAHHLPARRAADGRTGRPARRERHRRWRSNTSTGCRIFCSSPAAALNDKGAADVLWVPGQNR